MKMIQQLIYVCCFTLVPFITNAQNAGLVKDSTTQSTDAPKKKATFVNELPKDLADDSLVVMLLEEYSEANRNKNAKYREIFAEYPYPVLFVLPTELVAATKRHAYQLTYVDSQQLSMSNSRGRITVYNYYIRDNRDNIYHRIVSCIDCERTELGCLQKFIKAIAKRQNK